MCPSQPVFRHELTRNNPKPGTSPHAPSYTPSTYTVFRPKPVSHPLQTGRYLTDASAAHGVESALKHEREGKRQEQLQNRHFGSESLQKSPPRGAFVRGNAHFANQTDTLGLNRYSAAHASGVAGRATTQRQATPVGGPLIHRRRRYVVTFHLASPDRGRHCASDRAGSAHQDSVSIVGA